MIADSADVSANAQVAESAQIWDLAQVREGASIGAECIVGRGAYIGAGVHIAPRCKIQNFALVYEPAVLETGVFIGPGAILTNDRAPRAVRVDGQLKTGADWQMVGVYLREGVSVGAGAVCVAPLVVGRWAVIGAGSVVTRDVPDFALVAGAPARRLGWVGRSGARLAPHRDDPYLFFCPESNERYREIGPEELVDEPPQSDSRGIR